MTHVVTLEGLRRAWIRLWRPSAVIAALMIVLSPRTGALGLLVAVLGAVLWRSSATSTSRTRELGRYVAGFAVFALLRNLADDVTRTAHYDYVIRWERGLFGTIPTLALQQHLLSPGHWSALDLAVVAVYLSYFLIPPTVLVLLWMEWPDRLRPYVTSTLAMFGISVVVHVLLPTAPPWLAGARGHLPPVYQVVRLVFGEYAPATYEYGQGLSGNAVAAMPSVHLAVTTLIACALWPTRLRGASLAYMAAMLFTVVYGGEHYVVDGVAGVTLAGFAWWLASRGRRRAGVGHASEAGQGTSRPVHASTMRAR
jgi:PAP2 superfamily